ncbi:MAG TPA: Ada metal-binding domain-containing protein [Methanotrichaceae archaeon]|nr:Ada metal-binding domain-containing protein [Methanotrichaceae archaeon]
MNSIEAPQVEDAGVQDNNSSIRLDLSFESEIDNALFRTWGKAILWSKRPLPYLLLNATLLHDGSAIGQARYLLIDVEPLKDYSFDISRTEKADLNGDYSYSCLLEATGPDGTIASETRQCQVKYYPPEPSGSVPGPAPGIVRTSIARTPDEEWPDYESPAEAAESEQVQSESSGDDEADSAGTESAVSEKVSDDSVNQSQDEQGSVSNTEGSDRSVSAEPAQAPVSPRPDRGAESYVGSKSSKKYHKMDCRYALKLSAKNRVTFKDIDDAESQGYEPCKVCSPAG